MQKSESFKSINPVDNSFIHEVDVWTSSKIQQELEIGEKDWIWWSTLSVADRLKHIEVIREELSKHKEKAAEYITKEMGKPIIQSRAEITKCLDLCTYYIEHSEEVLSSDKVKGAPFSYNEIVYQPLGGILGVMPWNFPFWQVFRFALPALIAGNIIWLKHAPNMNLCNALMESIFNLGLKNKIYRATFVQISDLEQLVEHKHIQGTSLTGSERAGSSFAALSGKHIKKTLLELGGNDAFIICEDADLKEATHKAVLSRMINSGQTCISTKRLYVPHSKIEEVKALLIDELNTYKKGDLYSEDTKIGVMARPDLAESIKKQTSKLEGLGFENWVTVGEDVENFVAPRIYFSNGEHVLFDEELFGPVLIVYGYSEINDVVASINRSDFGLGAAIWSRDMDKAKYLARVLTVGSVAINNIVQSNAYLPFGGIKKSGFGRELGKESLLEFVNKKVIYS